MSRLKETIAEKKFSENDFKKLVSFSEEKCKSYFSGECEPSLEDLVEISQTLDVSIDYLLGQAPKITNSEKERDMLFLFDRLSLTNQIKVQKYMVDLYEESVAADSSYKKTGTDNLGK